MFLKRQDPYMLIVGMAGVKLGDELLQVGCAHGGRLAALAGKVGLSGRAVAVVPDDASAERARKGAAAAGVLVDVEVAPPTRLPQTSDTVDLAIVDDTADGVIGSGPREQRIAAIRELRRVLRPGGRAMIVGSVPLTGVSALFARAPRGPDFARSGDAAQALQAEGFRSVRTLAEREGLIFVEAIKPRQAE